MSVRLIKLFLFFFKKKMYTVKVKNINRREIFFFEHFLIPSYLLIKIVSINTFLSNFTSPIIK
jgi:hypothetical protein